MSGMNLKKAVKTKAAKTPMKTPMKAPMKAPMQAPMKVRGK